jgi:hypothetical protein
MAEQVKLQHLWRGIKPSLVEKFWSMKPATTDEFLTEVKRYQEMTSKSRHEEWAMGMLGKQMPPVENDRLDRLEKMLEGLMIGTKETEKPQKNSGNQNDSGQRPRFQWAPHWAQDGSPICVECKMAGHIRRDCPKNAQQKQAGRKQDGKIVCFGCGESGHIRPNCPKNKQQGQAQHQWQGNAGHKPGQMIGLVGAGGQQIPGPTGPLPILKIDIGRMVTQDVLCGEKRVSAVIDTGAVVSVCSLKLAKELKLQVTAWKRNRLVAVDGKEITPCGAAWMSISDRETRVEGEVLVLEGDIDLLLGKDILEKFGTRMKIGALPEIFIGEMPVGATTERVEGEETKLVMQRDGWIPARTMKIVAIKPLELTGPEEYALVEPSEALMTSKKVSTGKALIPGMGTLREIAVTNLLNQKQWVEADTVLGRVEYVERIVEESDAVFVAAECKGEEGNGEGFDFDSRIFKGLSPSQRKKILQALLEHDDQFARPGDKLGTCTVVEHAIDTGDAKPLDVMMGVGTMKEPTDAETMAGWKWQEKR